MIRQEQDWYRKTKNNLIKFVEILYIYNLNTIGISSSW